MKHETSTDPFPPTNWSNVIGACKDDAKGQAALNVLCQNYWFSIYAFVRRRVNSPHDAEDLTQEYLTRLLSRDYIQQADQTRGRFRAFLIHDLKFFLGNAVQKTRAEKRGGDSQTLSLDMAWAESRYEPADESIHDHDACFDRQWALQLVDHAKTKLAADYEQKRRGPLFKQLQRGLATTPTAADYEKWSEELSISPDSLKVAMSRLRKRFRAALEAQVRETVTSEDDFKSEMHHLRQALSQTVG
jgi:RNA polymerase sigma-70 factor (ECF subfamily)